MKYVLIAALLIIILLGLFTCPQRPPALSQDGYPVVRVVDGDTFICNIAGEDSRVRLIGVDTPESVHPNKEVEHFGVEASDFLKQLLKAENVLLAYDQANIASNHKDRYGRILAYAYRASDSLFINAEIIRQGYGHAYTSYPFRYLEDFLKFERDARTQGLGLWADSPDKPPTVADSVIVYFSGKGKKFHRENCRYTTEKSIPIPRSEAISKGMEPCKICKP
jgi:micrococcal nuclease